MPEEEEREKLARVIRQWNNNRLDLFEISQPDANLVFHGVMRFYLEDHDGGHAATKCLRFSSNSSTRELIETLSEKFRPDMKMLTTRYSLYEIHSNQERKLDPDEKPLVVQLNWTSDRREGRLVLRRDTDGQEGSDNKKEKGGVIQTFRRTLSRKEKKEKNKPKTEGENGSRTSEPSQNHIKNQQSTADPLEDAFLSAVINYTNSSTVHFKLSPAYVLYAAGRFALHRQTPPPSGKTHRVTSITNKMAAMTGKVIQRQHAIAGALGFWMANASELFSFFKHDKDLCRLTQQSQLDLSHLVLKAFRCLIECFQSELRKHLPTFLIDPEQHGPLPAGIEMVLNTLMNAMSLLRRCQVNPALTIQLFSQLFHFISIWLFNHLLSPEANAPGLRSHYWGAALRLRLTPIEAWAERQGLELAANCHLGHIVQATMLLTMNKYSLQDAKDIQNTCFKLNSRQLQTLLTGYFYAPDEPHIPPDLIDAVVTAAGASADLLIGKEGRDIQLEESLDLHLPFLLPEGGYSPDSVRGVPPGMREFLEPICQKGLCSLTSSPEGDWTVFFSEPPSCAERTLTAAPREPQLVTVTLKKPLNSGMGVSIVAAKGAGQDNLRIYIKSIVRGGPAEMDGRLTAGDQLLSVDGRSLVGLSQERAAAIMMQTGPIVTLQVVKSGASYHGLGGLLCEASPAKTAGDRSHDELSHSELLLHSGAVPSEQPNGLHGCSERTKDQQMQRNRQFYRSNPNVAEAFALEDRADPRVQMNNSVSTVNLCTDTFHREYLTLPTPKSMGKSVSDPSRTQTMFQVSLRPLDGRSSMKKRTFMRQALSQENLCVDDGRPLLDKRGNKWQDQSAKQSPNYYSHFPIRLSYSDYDILSVSGSPSKHQPGTRAGVWKTPFSQQPTPAPSTQPIRIDIPVSRAVSAQSNPPLTTFQQSSAVRVAKTSQTLNWTGQKRQGGQGCDNPACLISAAKKLPSNQTNPHVSTTPTKRVSFQEPAATAPTRGADPQELSGPWRREAQERLEKQQRLRVVALLDQEVQQLQAKAQRTAEENERLRKLSLEWQFQKRLQEIQQRGEDEDEDEELDMMVTIQQLEKRVQVRLSVCT
ncbi:afadin [Aulostomus maculatus]